MVLAFAGPEGRALRGEEAVVGTAFDACLDGRHLTGCAGSGEGGGRNGGNDEGELHSGGGGF